MNKPPIFIVGCPRSGTSLLRNLLRSFPNISFPRESHIFPKLYKAFGDPKNEKEAVQMGQKILNYYRIKAWELELNPEDFSKCRSYAEIISLLFENWLEKDGNATRWGDKTPQYVLEIPTLVKLFPDCKIIHIYRDGRDVALSWISLPFGPENIFCAALAWRHYVKTGLKHASILKPETYLEVQYESLLTNSKSTMKKVSDFLDEPFDETQLKPTKISPSSRPENYSGFKYSQSNEFKYSQQNQIVKTNFNKWKSEMSDEDLLLFESVAGDTLKILGYTTLGNKKNITIIEKSYWLSHHLLKYTYKQLKRGSKSSWIPGLVTSLGANIRSHFR
jgi:hypothetical protein